MGASALRGVSVLVARTLGFQLLTAGVTVALARLLTPEDYGMFAIALSVQLAGQHLTELGLQASLVRMREQPSDGVLSAVSGFLVTVTIVAVTTAALLAFLVLPALGASSDLVKVIAVTLGALPLYGVRAVPMAMMDRDLAFGRVATVEAADTVGFNAFALLAAILGLGAFSLAGAVPFGAFLGALAAHRLRRTPRPGWDFALVRPLLGIGSKVSLIGLVVLGRDLGLVSLIGAIGGTAMAGFYGMARRLFSFPTALAAAVARVTLPALSRSDENRLERTGSMIGLTALACGLPLALVAGAIDPLIQVVLGSEWLPSSDIVLYGSLGMFLTACVSAPMNGFFIAEGRPDTAVVAMSLELVLACGAAAALVGAAGVDGIGTSMSAGSLGAAVVLLFRAPGQIRAGARSAAVAIAVAAASALIGNLLPVEDDFVGLVISLLAVGAAWSALTALTARAEVRGVLGIALDLLRRRRAA